MKQDQLEKARQTRWRQDGNALLTLDDAERWLRDTPLCLFLPRYQHLPVPAPSFVEAVAGRSNITPTPDEIAAASQMLARLVASGGAIALNLFGSPSGMAGEQPDFLATPEALPYLYALQPERNPKRAPSTVGASRVSPLAAEAYAILEREGALTAIELRERLGREVTEAAVLRALGELWHSMRAVPVPDEQGAPAHWELLNARHRRELNIGSTQSQGAALSMLVSFYLQSAVAAAADQVGIFLSPVASRSRIREVVHALSATRQLGSFPLNGEGQLYVEGTLPEIAEEEETAAAPVSETAQLDASVDAGLEQNEPSFAEAAAGTLAAPRKPAQRPSFSNRARGRFTPRGEHKGERPQGREGGFRRPQRSGDRPFGAERSGSDETVRPPRPNFERRGRPSPSSETSNRPDRSDRPDRPGRFARGGPSSGGPSRGGPSRGGSFKPGFSKSPASFERRGNFGRDRPARPAGEGFRRDRPAGDRPPRTGEGVARFRPASGGGRPPFRQGRPPASAGERPSRPFPSRADRGPAGEGRSSFRSNRPSGLGRPSGPPRSFGPGGTSRPDRPFRKPFGDRSAGGPPRFDSRPPRREGQSRPQGDRPFKRPYSPAGDRRSGRPAGPGSVPPPSIESGGERPERTFTPRPRPSRPQGQERDMRPFRTGGQRPGRPGGFSKPGGRPGSFGKPGSFNKPRFGKPSADRPAAGGDRPERALSPRPAFGSGARPPRPAAGGDAASGPRKPGGFRKAGGPGKSFGKPRPAGKGRTSTTTSSGKPRRPGGIGAPRPAGGRPPAKGGFKPRGGFKPGGKRPGGPRAGGSAPPKRKPRGESGEGGEG